MVPFGWVVDLFLLRHHCRIANRLDIVRLKVPLKYREAGCKDLQTARLLCLFGGIFGLHRFYLGGGRTMTGGLLMLIRTMTIFVVFGTKWPELLFRPVYILYSGVSSSSAYDLPYGLEAVWMGLTCAFGFLAALIWIRDLVYIKEETEWKNKVFIGFRSCEVAALLAILTLRIALSSDGNY
jgi:hypothetical protein